MSYTTKNVGFDVHSATVVAAVRTDTGKLIAEAILPTEEAAILEFIGGMRGSVHVAFEEGTQAQWLYELLHRRVDRVVVCDRRGQRRAGNKRDGLDAQELSEGLRCGTLKAVYHGTPGSVTLKEMARAYANVVQDAVRVMGRLKAIFRARAIPMPGKGIYRPAERQGWLDQLTNPGARFRAEALYAELETLGTLRPKAKAAMIREARRHAAWPVLRSIPFLGEVRVSQLLAILQTPWRFRTKRNLWAYAGLAVVTHTSAEYVMQAGRPVRRRRAPLTRGLNRNHNRQLKEIFKGAATAAASRPGPLQDFYQDLLARGLRPELARVTLARKLAAITLRLWKTGDHFDPTQLTVQAH